MRILVLGAGGIGGTIASRLALAGENVTVCCRSMPKNEVIRCFDGYEETEVAVPFLINWSPADFDLVVVAVRPNQLEAALRSSAGASCIFAVCQNGLCEPTVRSLVGSKARIIGAVVSWGASRVDGRVIQTAKGVTTLGSLDGAPLSMADPVCKIFAKVHPVSLTENLVGVRWSKLALNAAASALCVALGGHLGLAFRRPSAIMLGVKLIEEVCAVSALRGIEMEPISNTLDLRVLFGGSRNLFRRAASVLLLTGFALRYFKLESSMWRAMKKGEASGIDLICGAVVDADFKGDLSRFNYAVTQAVSALENGRIRHGSEALDYIFKVAESGHLTTP